MDDKPDLPCEQLTPEVAPSPSCLPKSENGKSLLKGLPNTSFQNSYQQWQHRIQKFVNAEGNYFEGDIVTKN
ncbi:hypothetical protein TNCV_2415441 [Trichonephila clavipes]|nr:hypothetical protein TNCV_2415441 [Trichonephila clavipes]